MDTMSRLRASFRSSTRRKKKATAAAVFQEDGSEEREEGLCVSFQEIELELRPKESFRPSELRVLFSVPESGLEVISSTPSPWEPSLKSSLNGVSVWVPPFELQVPLSETQDAFFLLENLKKKKIKPLAKARISLKDFALSPPLRLKLRPLSKKIASATLNLSFNDKGTRGHPPPVRSGGALLLPMESLSLAEDDFSSEQLSPKSLDVSWTLQGEGHPSLENIPDLPSKEDVREAPLPPSSSSNSPRGPHKIQCESPPSPPRTSVDNVLCSPSTSSSTSPRPRKTPTVKSPQRSIPSSTLLLEDKPLHFDKNDPVNLEDKDLSNLILIPEGLLSCVSNNSQRDLSCPSPSKSDEDASLLEWAKEALKPSDRIKITNLTSSWRNGIGYCVLLHSKCPDFIPLNILENHNHESNRKLASELVVFLGGKPLTSSPPPSLSPTKEDIVAFLKEIKRILEEAPVPSAEDLKRWKEVCPSWCKEDENDSSPSSVFESKESSPEKKGGESESPTKNEKAKRLIQEAHSNFGVVTFRRNKGLPSPSKAVPPEVRQSVILLKKELISLAEEEERITNEKNELEKQLRAEASSAGGGTSSNIQSKKLKRWIELVNERHSLVRRQMQLNIKEKESLINGKLEDLREQLREFEEISESLKTEEMRNEEQALIEELVKTVNEKNELVHHLDNEEKAIDEDERIKSLLEEQTLAGNSLNNIKNLKVAGVGADECVIM